MVKEYVNGLMAIDMKDNLWKMNFVVKVVIDGLKEKCMMENG
jgi:hypothetical protein